MFCLSDPVTSLVQTFKTNNIHRGWVHYDRDTKVISVSHPSLQPLADFLKNDTIDFNQHEAIFLQLSSSDTMMGAFVWWTNRGQAAGGVRFRPYNSIEEYIRDGARLSMGMGRKNAAAGLWWGGGKGVCAHPPGDLHKDPVYRETLFKEYGEFLSSLDGCYVTAEDSGVTVRDVDNVFSKTRFTTCISSSLGGSGNPSLLTAVGVVVAMEAALEFLGKGDLQGKTIGIQGVGQVGFPLVKNLLAKNVKRIVAAESSEDRLKEVQAMLNDVDGGDKVELKLVPFGNNSVLFEDADIVSPNAWGGTLNPESIQNIRANIVCGAANNQLMHSTDDELMKAKGICYVPDFVANRMGIVNCANEQYGRLEQDPMKLRHFDKSWEHGIHATVLKILTIAKAKNQTNNATAEALADEAARQLHPIVPNRNYQIIKAVVASSWANN